jgi:hypothetical protein
VVLALLCTDAGAASLSQLRHREHRQARTLSRYEGTLRFFANHAWLVRRPPTRSIALREIRKARVWVAVIRRELAETRASLRPRPQSVPQIICAVFGPECSKALQVFFCESRYSTSARNGQYFGIGQMGSAERARFGGSSLDPWDQVRAAYAYYRVAGWSPWQCA